MIKSLFRKILFIESHIYLYPYSSDNLNEDLKKIFGASYFDKKTTLRGKKISDDSFSLWEKWNLFGSYRSFDALGVFSGTKVNRKNKTLIIATIYPNALSILLYYLLISISISAIYFYFFGSESIINIEIILVLVAISFIIHRALIFQRKRIKKSVEFEFNLKRYKH